MKHLLFFISFLMFSAHANYIFAADNIAPSVVSEVVKTAVGKSVVIDVLANDSDSDGTLDTTSLVVLRQTSYGTVAVNNILGVITYTPNASYEGPDSFDYSICDDSSACGSATVTILVQSSVLITNNDRLGSVYSTEGGVFTSVLNNDLNQGSPLNISDVILSVTIPSSDPNVYIDLASGDVIVGAGVAERSYQITYQVCLVQTPHICSEAVVSIKVIQRAPYLGVDKVTTIENKSVSFGVLDNDTDIDGTIDTTTLVVNNIPSNGTISLDAATSIFTYVPNPNFNGNDSFRYRVCDDKGACSVATVNVTVEPHNLVAMDDVMEPIFSYYGGKSVSVLTNDTLNVLGVDSSDVLISVLSAASDPTVFLDTISGRIVVAPNTILGTYQISYKVCEEARPYICDSATAEISVNQTPPVLIPDSVTTIENRTVKFQVLENDTDVDGTINTSTLVVSEAPSNGTVSLDVATGIFTYVPNPNFNGNDSFTYRVCDDKADCSVAPVYIYVEPHNLIAVDDVMDSIFGYYGGKSVSVLKNDTLNVLGVDSSDVLISVITAASDPSVYLDTISGRMVVSPRTVDGAYQISYKVCEVARPYICDSATTEIAVKQIPPVILPDSVTTIENHPFKIDVLANDTDIDGDLEISTLKVTTAPANGTVSIDPLSGIITYISTTDYNGTDSLEYTVCDNKGECGTAMVHIIIEPHNLEATADTYGPVIGYYGAEFGTVLANDTLEGILVDTTSITLSVILAASDAGVYLNTNNGTVVVMPRTPDDIYEISYKVCEKARPYICDSAIATITVNQLAPVANFDTARTIENVPVEIDVLANDTDLDGTLDVNTVTEVVAPAHGTIFFDGLNGEITYESDDQYNGNDTFIYSVCDDKGECDTARVNIVIEPHDLVASDDVYGPIYGFDGAHFSNVLDNDLLEDGPVDFTNITLTVKTPASDPAIYLDASTGDVTVDTETSEGIYTITYEVCQVTRPHICDTAIITVLVTNDCKFLVPEIFSPNGDGIQDVFHIRCIEQYTSANIEIFNRWGNKVYSKKQYGNTDVWGRTDAWWDGSSNNGGSVGGEKLTSGTYYYVLQLNDGSTPRKGFIYLNR